MAAGETTRPGVTERPSFREGFGFGGLSFAVGGVLSVVSTIVVARLYGIEVIGEYALAYAPTGFVWFLSSAKERPALVRVLATLPPRAPRVAGLFAAVFAFSIALTIVASAIAVGAAYLVFNGPIGRPDLFGPAVASIGSYLVLTNTCWNIDTILVGFRAGRQLFWVRLHQSAAYFGFAVVASLVSPTVWSLIIALAASWLTSLGHRLVAARRWIDPRVPRNEVREGFRALPEIIRFGLKITPGAIAQGVTSQAATWILGIVGSVAAVGAWNRVWLLSRRLLDLNARLTEMLFPTLVERLADDDRRGFERALIDSLRYVAVAMLWPAAVAGGAAFGVMELFGPGFTRAADALALIALVPPMTATIMFLNQALFALDRPLLSSALALARMAITVAATIPLAISLGITGAALGMLIGAGVQVAAQTWLVRRQLESPVRRWVPYRYGLVLILAYASGFLVARAADSALAGLLGVSVSLLAGSAAYMACFLAGRGVLPRDRDRFAAITERFRRRSSEGPATSDPAVS